MKKVILMALSAIVCFMLAACEDSEIFALAAKGAVPLIARDGAEGKFSYFTPIQSYKKVYPISLLDSVRAVPRTPKTKVTYQMLDNGRFRLIVEAPIECLLSDMDSLKFVYPPEAKFFLREGIRWNNNQKVALAKEFWLVGIKNGVRRVYTAEGRKLSISLANRVLHSALDIPADMPKDSVP